MTKVKTTRPNAWWIVVALAMSCAQATPAVEPPPDTDDAAAPAEDAPEAVDTPAVAVDTPAPPVDTAAPPVDTPAPPVDAGALPPDAGALGSDTGPAPCAAGQTRCTGSDGAPTCVSLTTSRAHCGACGNACPADNACTNGRCVLACPQGQVACADPSGATRCADLTRDPQRCGSCTSACLQGETCSNSRCTSPCAAGEALCAGRCERILTDDAHCGQCNAACPAGTRCTQGVCAPLCATGQIFCDGVCRDPQRDALHCNGCGRACPAGQACVNGGCTVVCAPEEVNCTNVCRNLATDPSHCGRCNNACARGQVCTAGACTLACSTGQTACGAACVNLASDVNHCGACGAACAPRANSTARCLLSRCRWTCATGWGDCDANTANGCEAGLSTSTLHCGACNNACPAQPNSVARCTSGACGFVCLTGYADCNALATDGCEVNTRTSTSHCGACGRQCPAGSACLSGVCSQSTRALETFELAPWPRAPWVGASPGTRETTCAQGGAYGVLNPNWIYRTDVTVGAAGTRLSGWFRLTGTSGRAYMGFGATSAGAWSLVVAFNTSELTFQRNQGYGYTDLASTPVTWASGQWYRAEVEFGTLGRVTGRAYTAAGSLVATVSTTLTDFVPGGIALRTFGGVCGDTLESR